MNVQGRDCTLTVARDGELIPLPYSEETVRQTSKGYSLPGCIGERNRELTVVTGKIIEGCFITRLEYLNVLSLFLLFFNSSEMFELYADRIYEKVIYKNLLPKSFELRAENGEAFKLHLDVNSTYDSFTSSWPVTIPSLKWEQKRTYLFDGHIKSTNIINPFFIIIPGIQNPFYSSKITINNCMRKFVINKA